MSMASKLVLSTLQDSSLTNFLQFTGSKLPKYSLTVGSRKLFPGKNGNDIIDE